ncbi:hypothetical protein ACEN8I_05695 [Polaromonas sp. CT11-55]|uniref:hypothetical protein n=1 Tax=Polaromonas sp. CT11-55 TaxID=3243045 RepID=UPI0039A73648
MKTLNILAVAGALALLAACPARAGTLSGASSTLNGVSTTTSPPKITAPGQVLQIKHMMGVAYYGPDKNPNFTCNAKLEYSDGSAPEMVPIKYPMDAVGRMHQYTKPGKYTVSLTGVAHNGLVACLGWASTMLTIEDGLPQAPTGKPGAGNPAAAMMAPGAQAALQGMVPINLKAKVQQVVLRGGSVFSPGTVSLYSTIFLDKPDANCALEFSVTTLNTGSDALNVELMNMKLNGAFANAASTEFNPGTLNFPNQGKFRVTVRARPDMETHCSGAASADFEIKRQKMGGDPAPVPVPSYGSFISKVTAVEKADAWDITVHGSGDASCKYHVRAWTLPEMSIFQEQAMVYEKNVTAAGKGFWTVPKQGAKNVLIETVQDNEDKVANKGCLGTPKLELVPTPAAVFPPKPKKGVIMGLSVAKATYAPGEPIPSTLKVQGDNCSFVFRVRKLPFINLSDDVVFAAKTQSLEWDLNNLGQTLPAGKWTVISQPGTEAMAPGEIRCEIAPVAGSGQVFFTVAP